MIVFRDRSLYDPASDPVLALYVTVECNPGQAQAIRDFVSGVCAQGGVYAVDIEEAVMPPEVLTAVSSQVAVPVVVVQHDIVQDTKEAEGEVHAEPQLQPASEQRSSSAEGGSEAPAVEPTADVDAHADGELAEPAGEVGAGPGERSA